MRTGVSNLPLHRGKAPAWLFQRMILLAREMTDAMVSEYGPEEVLRRLSDPVWFQAFGCVLGFDWHSSGVTTTVCGALKEAVKDRDFGFYVCGGKGRTSRNTPAEIAAHAERLSLPADPLVYASRMSAKVDSSAVQDGYQIYQHCFLFTAGGTWSVVQQGMHDSNGWARRYHWLSAPSFVCEPHAAVCGDPAATVLNLVAAEGAANREGSVEMARQSPDWLCAELARVKTLSMPRRHEILAEDLNPRTLARTLVKTYESGASSYEELLGVPGVGGKTLRALSLIAELVYGSPASVRDPARFSFAHGGKDGFPYPVDREGYDQSIAVLRKAVESARVGHTERVEAFRRLAVWEV